MSAREKLPKHTFRWKGRKCGERERERERERRREEEKAQGQTNRCEGAEWAGREAKFRAFNESHRQEARQEAALHPLSLSLAHLDADVGEVDEPARLVLFAVGVHHERLVLTRDLRRSSGGKREEKQRATGDETQQ